jgi:hypothetical protein
MSDPATSSRFARSQKQPLECLNHRFLPKFSRNLTQNCNVSGSETHTSDIRAELGCMHTRYPYWGELSLSFVNWGEPYAVCIQRWHSDLL